MLASQLCIFPEGWSVWNFRQRLLDDSGGGGGGSGDDDSGDGASDTYPGAL